MAEDQMTLPMFAGAIDLLEKQEIGFFIRPKATPAKLDAMPCASSMDPRFRG